MWTVFDLPLNSLARGRLFFLVFLIFIFLLGSTLTHTCYPEILTPTLITPLGGGRAGEFFLRRIRFLAKKDSPENGSLLSFGEFSFPRFSNALFDSTRLLRCLCPASVLLSRELVSQFPLPLSVSSSVIPVSAPPFPTVRASVFVITSSG